MTAMNMHRIIIVMLALLSVGAISADADNGSDLRAFFGPPSMAKLRGVKPNSWTNLYGLPASTLSNTALANSVVRLAASSKFADEVWLTESAGADPTGTSDSGPAVQAAINACPFTGCTIKVPRGQFKMATCVTLKSGVTIAGFGQAQGYTNETRFFMAQISCPMFTLPGSTPLTPGLSTGIGFHDLTLDGMNINQPIISAQELNPGRGSWDVDIHNVVFANARPAIDAVNSWEWWVHENTFISCGNMASGKGHQIACLYISNSAQSYTGAATNSWHINNNYIDTRLGRGIIFDSSLGPNPITFMFVTNNHFGIRGYENIYGCIQSSSIDGNQSEGTLGGHSIFFFTNGGKGCGLNTIANNHLAAPGVFAITDNAVDDLILGNHFYIQGTGSAWIQLGRDSGNITVTNNKTVDNPCCNSIPIVLDLGSTNTIYNNDGSDGLITFGTIPFKKYGVAYSILTSKAPTKLLMTTVSGLPTCDASTKGMLYGVSDATSPTYNGALTGGGIAVIPAFCNGTAWTAH